MIFVITAHDKKDGLELRMATRDAHLAYLRSAEDRLKVAGPILTSGENPKPCGSYVVIDAASEAAVKLFAENDPYAKAGLFDSVTIKPWNPVLGAWVEDK